MAWGNSFDGVFDGLRMDTNQKLVYWWSTIMAQIYLVLTLKFLSVVKGVTMH
jgi:hypothetical protein